MSSQLVYIMGQNDINPNSTRYKRVDLLTIPVVSLINIFYWIMLDLTRLVEIIINRKE